MVANGNVKETLLCCRCTYTLIHAYLRKKIATHLENCKISTVAGGQRRDVINVAVMRHGVDLHGMVLGSSCQYGGVHQLLVLRQTHQKPVNTQQIPMNSTLQTPLNTKHPNTIAPFSRAGSNLNFRRAHLVCHKAPRKPTRH